MLGSIRDAQHALAQGDCDRAEALSSQIVREEPRNAAAWHLLGLARKKLGRVDSAVEAFAKAAEQDRRVARYHHDLGNALIDEGKIDRAITAFRRALRIDQGGAEVHNDLGAAYFEKGWHAEAEACFRKAIERDAGHAVAHGNLGAALRAQGRLSDSRRAYQRALLLRLRGLVPSFFRRRVVRPPAQPEALAADRDAVRQAVQAITREIAAQRFAQALTLARKAATRHPQEPDVLHAAALAFEEAKDIPAALEQSSSAIARAPDRTEYRILRARLLVKSRQHHAALEEALQALRLEPGSADVHAVIAGVCHPWHDEMACSAARRAIELDPGSHLGHANLAVALWGLGRIDEAERHAREAIRLQPEQADYRTNLAVILKDQGRLEEARGMYHELLARTPEDPKLALNLGILALECDGDLKAARHWYGKAQSSGEARPRLSEALLDLAEGNFGQGWDKYEARKEVGDQSFQHTMFAHLPTWDGKSDCRLLVYGEQGLGDEIMFASMLGELGHRVARITLMCDSRLGALFQRSFPALEVIAEPRASQAERAKGLQNIDAAVAAGSLGALFRRTVGQFQTHAGYLVADPAKVSAWSERLGAGRHLGLSWIGGLQKTGRSRRSIPLEALRTLTDLAGMAWVSLQHGVTGSPLREFPGVTDDLDELAALVTALDAAVTVCNTTVHLAGALGKRVLVMAPFVPEWRYGMSGDMLWYPSARVFRQSRYGDWGDVIAAVARAL
jgi:Flp pilus assembly protein TadD